MKAQLQTALAGMAAKARAVSAGAAAGEHDGGTTLSALRHERD